MKKVSQLYEGKAKKVWTTEDPELLIVDYKDDATAGNGAKKGTIHDKGIINNRMSNFMMKKLEEEYGVPTHFVEELSDRETVVKKCSIVPLEVIVRNLAAGSFSKRLAWKKAKRWLARSSNSATKTTRSVIRSATSTTSWQWNGRPKKKSIPSPITPSRSTNF